MTCTLHCTIEKKRPPPRLIPLTTVLAFVTWSPLSRVHGSSQAQGPPKWMDVALSRALPTCFPDRCTPAVHRQCSGNFITHYCNHPYLTQASSSRLLVRASHKLTTLSKGEAPIWPDGHGQYAIATRFWLEICRWAGDHWSRCSR